jgi:hypothetical protein
VAAKDVVLLVLLGRRGHLLPLALAVRQRGSRRARHTYKRRRGARPWEVGRQVVLLLLLLLLGVLLLLVVMQLLLVVVHGRWRVPVKGPFNQVRLELIAARLEHD